MARFEIIKSPMTGQFRFLFVASNGKVVAKSQFYSSKSSARKGIASIMREVPRSEVVDCTKNKSDG